VLIRKLSLSEIGREGFFRIGFKPTELMGKEEEAKEEEKRIELAWDSDIKTLICHEIVLVSQQLSYSFSWSTRMWKNSLHRNKQGRKCLGTISQMKQRSRPNCSKF
jgi:hypothetical protein